MQPRSSWNMSWVAIIGAAFVLLAVVGGIVTTRHMNKTADVHGMSAGRSGDALPNRISDQDDASAGGSSTTGTTTSNVPPASR